MEASIYIPDTALPQSEGSSDLSPSPGSSQVSVKVRYLIRGGRALHRLTCIFRHFPRKQEDDTIVLYVAGDTLMPSSQACGDISEGTTYPNIDVPFQTADTNGFARISTGITS